MNPYCLYTTWLRTLLWTGLMLVKKSYALSDHEGICFSLDPGVGLLEDNPNRPNLKVVKPIQTKNIDVFGGIINGIDWASL